MSHDYFDLDIIDCRKVSDGAKIRCTKCANYQPNESLQYTMIGPVTGHPDDCCNGFMGYYDHPHYWSECSVRMFEQHYIAEKWNQCMDTTTSKQSLRQGVFDLFYISFY